MKLLSTWLLLIWLSFSQTTIEKLSLLNEYKILHLENENWDWTNPNAYPDYFYINGKQPIQAVFPFYDATLGVVTELGDYKESDGWSLLYKDFGSLSRTVKMPYMVLYNKYNGMMRVLAFIVTPENYTDISLQTHFELNGSANLNFVSNRAHGLDWKERYVDKNAVGKAKGSDGHWMYSDVPIAYDNTIATQEHVAFIFDLMGIEDNKITLDGSIDLNQIDQAVIGNTGKVSLDFDAFQKTVGEKFDSWNKWTDRGESHLKKAAERIGENTDLGKNLLKKATAFKNAPFGILGAVFGIADFFLGGGNNTQTTPLAFEGSIHLRGTMTTKEVIGKLKMRVPGSKKPEYDYWKPVSEAPLGIFNLAVNPIFHRLKYDQWRGGKHSDNGTQWYSYKLTNDIIPIINQTDVTLEDIQAALVFTVEDPEINDNKTDFSLLADWANNGFIEVENAKVSHYTSADGKINEDRTYVTYRTPYMSLSNLKNKYINTPFITDDARKYYIDKVGVKIQAKFRPKVGGESSVLVTTYEPKIIDKDSEQKGSWSFPLLASISNDTINLKWTHLFTDVVARTTFRIQESSTGSTWNDIYTKTFPNPEFRNYRTTPSNSKAFRFYRLHMSDDYGLNEYSNTVQIINPNYVEPPSFTGSLSGNSYIQYKENATITANTKNGSGNYSYEWWYKYTTLGSGEDGLEPIASRKNKPSDEIFPNYIPTDSWTRNYKNTKSIQVNGTVAGATYTIKCIIRDITKNKSITAYKTFSVAAVDQGNFKIDNSFSQNDNIKELNFSIGNSPNPFNPTTKIAYTIPKSSHVEINVYNILGQKVQNLVNDHKLRGKHTVQFDGSNLASGIYIYRIKAGENFVSKKMILSK